MAMTLRLTADEDQALVLLASAWGCSKQEAARRSVVMAATHVLDEGFIRDTARSLLPGFAATEAKIRRAR